MNSLYPEGRDSIRQVSGAGLDALGIDGDIAEKFEYARRMSEIRSKATEIANEAWDLINATKYRDRRTGEDYTWPVIKGDCGQPELYSQICDGESWYTVQEPILVNFGEYNSQTVYLAIEIDYLGLSDDGIIGANAWARRITNEEQALLLGA